MAKQQSRFLALLRGINVGGKNLIAKDDLRQCFEDLGFTSVRTYIQSGNILFRSEQTRVRDLTDNIEAGLARRFSYSAQAVVLSHKKYRTALQAAPAGWGKSAAQKHNAIFTLRTTTPKRVLAQLPAPKPRIDTVTLGSGVIFWSAAKKQLTKSAMMRLAASPAYQHVTVRNHNTTFKLLELFESI